MDQKFAAEHEAPDVSKQNAGVLEFVRCMRDRGWQLPDPKPDARGLLQPPLLPENMPAEQQSAINEDLEECAARTPGMLGEGGQSAAVPTR